MRQLFILLAILAGGCVTTTTDVGTDSAGGFPSPDNKFEVIVKSTELGDSNTEWVYHLIDRRAGDTLLLTTAMTHDDPQPAVFWNKSSTRLVFEDRREKLNPIKVYDVKNRKTVFMTSGFVGRPMRNFYDTSSDVLFFLQHVADAPTAYNLFALDVQSNTVTAIKTLETSGDPYTGDPEIEKLDASKRALTISFEDKQYSHSTIELNY